MANAGYLPGPERRRQILAGAKRVFAARGYHDTNISHICDDLGIGRGTLYQYFESKKDVFAAIVEDLLERLRVFVESRHPLEIPAGFVPDAEVSMQFSVKRLRKTLEVIFEDEQSLRILLREAVGLDVHVDQIIRALDEIVIVSMVRDLETCQRAGIIRADIDARTVALAHIGSIQKLALDAMTREEKLDLDRISEVVTRIHLLGILERTR